MSQSGQERRFRLHPTMSAPTPITTKPATRHDGPKGPTTASRTATKSEEFNCNYVVGSDLRHHLFGMTTLAQLASDDVLDSAYGWLCRLVRARSLENHPDKTFIGRIERGFGFVSKSAMGFWPPLRLRCRSRVGDQRFSDLSAATLLTRRESFGTIIRGEREGGITARRQLVDVNAGSTMIVVRLALL
jgi:hypothetical protein